MRTVANNAIDGNVTLVAEDAQALADAIAALSSAPVRITAASPAIRQRIKQLSDVQLIAIGEEQAADLLGVRGAARRAGFRRLRIDQQLARARRDAIKEFAFPRGWKYKGPLGVAELHTGSLSRTWCETCGALCRRSEREQHQGGHDHDYGLNDALRRRRDYTGRTEAVILHTRHPFAACLAFAESLGLKVTQLDYSWYGKPTAAFFERVRR
jgi:hypothetical protein